MRPEQVVLLGDALLAGLAVLLAWTLWVADTATRRVIAAGMLLFGTAYGIISMGRVPIMMVSLQWVATRPRYHYLPLAAASITLGIASSVWQGAVRSLPWRR